MRYRTLGPRGPEISVVGFGAWAVGGANRFGWSGVKDDESIAAIQHAIESGINWVDTAAFYGKGHSEEIVAKALAPYAVGEEVLVFTKCGLRWDPQGGPDAPPRNDLSRDSIRFECEQSLKRLGIDRIDLYQFHWPDETGVPVEDSWGTMCELVDEGKVRWAGVSNFTVELLERCERIRHVDSVQLHFSLLHRDDYRELQPFCEENGIAILAYGPLGFGVLTGTMTTNTRFPDDDWRSGSVPVPVPLYEQIFAAGTFERHLAQADLLRPVAARNGMTPAQLALAWVVAQPGVTAALAGSRSPARVRENAAAGSIELTRGQLEEVDAALTAVASA